MNNCYFFEGQRLKNSTSTKSTTTTFNINQKKLTLHYVYHLAHNSQKNHSDLEYCLYGFELMIKQRSYRIASQRNAFINIQIQKILNKY
ncbi:MAG: hypothetical protein HC932_02050 [Thermales bacterium]|nr:hypothetical protein [Thermales bacterium]